MNMRIPPLQIMIMLESNPLKSIILVRRLAADSASGAHVGRVGFGTHFRARHERSSAIGSEPIVAIFYPFSQFCEINVSLLSLQNQPNTAPNLFQRGVEYGKYGATAPPRLPSAVNHPAGGSVGIPKCFEYPIGTLFVTIMASQSRHTVV